MNPAIARALLLLSLGIACAPPASAQGETERKAIAAIHQLGGKVRRDNAQPGKPVVEVKLDFTETRDDGLVHLKAFPELQRLDLSHTYITNAGLAHVKGFARLESLQLALTNITDDGLVHLKGLKSLKELAVSAPPMLIPPLLTGEKLP